MVRPHPGFRSVDTRLKVISVLRGQALEGKDIHFRHYAPGLQEPMCYMPQHYTLIDARTYLVFAKKTDQPGVFCQLSKNHRTKEDQGLVLTAFDAPLPAGQSVKEIVWSELTQMLKSRRSDDAIYGIRQLAELCGLAGYSNLSDFEPATVIAAVAPLLRSADDSVLKAAIETVGARSTFMDEYRVLHFLAGFGRNLTGVALDDPRRDNPGARRYWREFVAIADSQRPLALRALAIRALGRAGVKELRPILMQWAAAPDAPLRESAALALSDFPDAETQNLLKTLATDANPAVRKSVARAIGFGQMGDLLPTLERLLIDEDETVTAAAAMSLLSLPMDKSRKVLQTYVDHPDYRPLFVNALAGEIPTFTSTR